MVRGNLATLAGDHVSNVVVFVSDSLRYDAVPESIAEMGVYGRGVSGSTFTASGYPSILTGQYPSTHRVWNFEDALAERPPLLTQHGKSGVDATDVWTNVDDPAKKPPLRIPGETEDTTLSELESPYVHVVHDRGGHMIYGDSDEEDRWDDHDEFFDDFAGESERIAERYRESVRESLANFRSIVEALKARGEYDETLVVLTSDHGELLGEYGGLYTHGVPIVPELVDVPMLFAGAGFPEGVRFDGLLSTADVAPTALSAVGARAPGAEGYDLWTGELPRPRVARTEVWKETSYDYVTYQGSAVWTESGGHVRRLDPLPNRLLHFAGLQLYYASYANMVRRPSPGLYSAVKLHVTETTTFGNPPSRSLVDDHLVTDFSRLEGGIDQATPDTHQLRELGYLE